jgi:nucleotide-binding universal stress UspA family protein
MSSEVVHAAANQRRILVPLDRSQLSRQAIPYALAIARPGDEIVFLHAVPLPDISPVLLPEPLSVADLSRELKEAAAEDLDGMLSRVRPPEGVTVKSMLVDGHPADEIVRHASSAGTAMIVMTTAGRGAVGRLAYGSVADRVARTSPVPVLLVRGDPDARANTYEPAMVRRLVVPLDGSSRAHHAVPKAAALAKHLGVRVLLVSVNEAQRMSLVYGSAFSAAAYAEIAENAERQLDEMLTKAADELQENGIETDQKVLTGATAFAINGVAEMGDVIVMTSHGRSGLRRWLLGSVAEQLIRNASVPVVLVPSM